MWPMSSLEVTQTTLGHLKSLNFNSISSFTKIMLSITKTVVDLSNHMHDTITFYSLGKLTANMPLNTIPCQNNGYNIF